MWHRRWLCCLFIPLVMACSRETEKPMPAQSSPDTPRVVDQRPVILAFGDSLTAGHGVELSDSYPSLLQRELDIRGYKYRVVNAGVSGDTTSGGFSRIDSALALHPEIVILELGANDGLRGLPLQDATQNLEQMILKSQKAGARVLLAGMTLPLNYGPDYIHDFETMFPDLALKHHTALIPFFLEGVAARPDLNQQDGIHPNARGYVLVTRNVLRFLEPLLRR
jgi:acyl-CoA thioesterase I